MDAECTFASEKALLGELAAELAGHAFGLRSYTAPAVAGRAPLRARAEVELLEGTRAVVELGAGGYRAAGAARAFESLAALLHAASPAFGRAMHAELVARLLPHAASEPPPGESQPAQPGQDFSV